MNAPRAPLRRPARPRGPVRPAPRTRAPALLVVLALISCATAGGFRERNRENLARLAVGMTRDEVMDLMGTESVRVAGTETGAASVERDTLSVSRVEIPVGGSSPVLRNPVRNATFDVEGQAWEVLFYYTDLVTDDGRVTDDEVTPVVLRDGLVTGWGWDYWRAQITAYDIPAEVPDVGARDAGALEP